jgi:cellulose synthase/poly-beta-1,6-N-acetylglucosamine synthase-like glycosyltransferase
VLDATLDSIRSFNRDDWEPKVVVIADNCTDRTADIARAHGASVIERVDTINMGKGAALAWAFDQGRLLEDVDYLFLLDADVLPETDALDAALARAYETGADIVQVPFISRGKNNGHRSAMNVWTTTLMNRVRPRGLTALGLPCRLQGGGILISRAVAEEYGWPAQGVSEDLFATLAYLDEGVKITYTDAAVVWARAAETDAAAMVQRVRWESGRIRATGLLPDIAMKALRTRSPEHAAMAAHLAVPPVTIHTALIGVGLISALAVRSRLAFVHLASGVMTILYLAEGLRAMGDRALATRALLAGPRFAAWKLRVQWRAIRAFRRLSWERTPRDDM